MSELFYYKNNLYWSLKPNGLIMENYYINDGYFTTSIESNLRIVQQYIQSYSTFPHSQLLCGHNKRKMKFL